MDWSISPMIFTMEDIRRFPSQSRIHFLECSGNPVYTKPYGKTASDLVGLLSCAEWTGVSLKLVLEEAGLRPEAKWLVAEGADAAALTRSIPIEKCLDDAMLVYSQNGERLRPQQGYPLRLLLPGFEGNMNVKWLRRLKAVDRAGLFARGNLEIYRPDAGRHGARIHLLHGSEIHHHPAVGRAKAQAQPASTKSPALPGAGTARSSASTSRSMAARTGRKRNCRSRY